MDRILNVSDRANAAIHALALAARNEARGEGGSSQSARRVALELGVSSSYLAKVLQSLSRAGLVASSRGASGGFSLAREAEGISALEVIEILEGPLPSRACLFGAAVCATGGCALKALCQKVEVLVRETLASTSIGELSRSL